MRVCEQCGAKYTPVKPKRGGSREQRFCCRKCRDKHWQESAKMDRLKAKAEGRVIPRGMRYTAGTTGPDNGADLISYVRGLIGVNHLLPSGPVLHYRPGDPVFNELARQYAR